MNKKQQKRILKELKKMMTVTGFVATTTAAVTACGKTNTNNTTEPTGIVTEAVTPTETVTKAATPTVTVEVTPTEAVATITEKVEEVVEYPDDYFVYDDEEPTYEGSLVEDKDPSKFVVGPDGDLYESQEDIDNLFPGRPEDVYALYTYEGETYENYIIFLLFKSDMIDVEYNEDHILVEKPLQKTKCK